MWLFKPNIEKLKAKKKVIKLIKLLYYTDSVIREKALDALVELEEFSMPMLIKRLKIDSIGLQLDLDDLDIIGPIRKYYKYYEIPIALEKIGKFAVEPLIAILKKNKFYFARILAARILGKIGDERAIESLIAALKDEHEYVRQTAIEELEFLVDKRVVEPLIAVLQKDEYYSNRISAARALGKIGDSRSIHPLITTMDKDMSDKYDPSVQALIEIGKPAIEPLIEALKNENDAIANKAAGVLKNITGESFGMDFKKWQQWWEQNKY